jgi:hypothetical protein
MKKHAIPRPSARTKLQENRTQNTLKIKTQTPIEESPQARSRQQMILQTVNASTLIDSFFLKPVSVLEVVDFVDGARVWVLIFKVF